MTTTDQPTPSTTPSGEPKTPVSYNRKYSATGYQFETTRKALLIAETLFDHPKVELVDPSGYVEQAERLIGEVHSPEYVEAVRTGEPLGLAESQGFDWDPGIYTTAINHAAGLVAAVNEVLTSGCRVSGSLSSGLHHARRDEGSGFCTFNGLAVAAREALRLGAKRVLVLDFDAHGGGGTRSLCEADKVVQVDVSVSPFDLWHPTTDDDYLKYVTDPTEYVAAIDEALEHASGITGVDLVLYNAGMDPANEGVSADDLAERERLVAEWCAARNLPVVYALAGGYLWNGVSWDDLVALHRLTIDTFVN